MATPINLTLDVLPGISDTVSEYLEWLEKPTDLLSRLSSLAIVIRLLWVHEPIRGIAPILERIDKTRVTDVRIEFKPDRLCNLGHCFSQGCAALEASKRLEDVLLAFSICRVLVHIPARFQRAGRAEFWSPILQRAFPTLSERGLLSFTGGERDASAPRGHEGWVTCLVASPDSKWFVTAACDGTIIVWDALHGTIVREWVAHQGSIDALALSPDSRRLVSAGRGSGETLAIWDIHDGVRKVVTLRGHTKAVSSCAWSPDGVLIASASRDGTLRVWVSQTFQQCDLLRDPVAMGQPSKLQFSPRTSLYSLAWTSGPVDCFLWNPLSGEQAAKRLPSHWFLDHIATNALLFDPEGRRLATAHGNSGNLEVSRGQCVVRIWDVATGSPLAVVSGHSKAVTAISFSANGKSLLSASSDGSVMVSVWDGGDSGTMRQVRLENLGDYDGPSSVTCFSPDRQYVVITEWLGRPGGLWRTADGSRAAVLPENYDTVSHSAFSPNGKFLAFGDSQGIVYVHRLLDFVGH